MTGVSKNTVTKLLTDLGVVCSIYQDRLLRDLPCERIQCDEIWAFCYSKQKNVPQDKKDEFGYGDVWTHVALCADTKLAVSYLVGERGSVEAQRLMADVAKRLRHRVQVSTDGHAPYMLAVRDGFDGKVDHGVIVKQYAGGTGSGRYSPAVCIGASRGVVRGNPDPDHISTSYVERSNLTMRMSMRRFTRLTNAFSKKVENLTAAVSLHFFHYNFCRVHQTLATTPAVAAGVTDHVWTLDELVGLLVEAESFPTTRGRYTKTREREQISN
jgi:IS1 family transposase